MPIGVEPPESWLNAQRLGIGLKLLSRRDLRHLSCQERLRLEKITFSHLPNPPSQSDYSERLLGIHPATLRALTEIEPKRTGIWDELKELRFSWEAAYRRLQAEDSIYRLSILAGAKLVANRILTTNFTASQIIQIVESEMECSWPKETIEPLQKFANSLREERWDLPTQKRLKYLADFKQALTNQDVPIPDRWGLVENWLLQQWLIWPLLVNKEEKNALSLPFVLDVFPNRRVELIQNNKILSPDSSFVESLGKAEDAACELWVEEHMSWPLKFVRGVDHLKVSIDFAIAESILDPYKEFLPKKIPLQDESAGLYFALAILSKLVAPEALEAVCATGVIGERRAWGGKIEGKRRYQTVKVAGADHMLLPAGSLTAKCEYVRDTYYYDTLLIPLQLKKWDLEVRDPGHLRVVKVTSSMWSNNRPALSEAANMVFRQNWRKHRYVRCPDLAISFKPKNKRLRYTGMPQDPDVETVLEKIRTNTQPVLRLDASDPHHVAKALYYINYNIQPDGPKGEKSRNLGTYAFIRLVKDETNERFWHTLWRLIDGDTQRLRDFQFSSTSERATKIFAQEMNKRPTNNPRRAPDVLVIVGGNDDDTDRSIISNGPFARYRIANLEWYWNEELEPIDKSRSELRKYLGATRLILVPDTQENTHQCLAPTDCFPKQPDEMTKLRDKVAELSVFRFGFTQEMARRMWEASDQECAELLDQAQRRRLLYYAEGAGEYVCQMEKGDIEGDDVADRHYDAAQAIVGFLNPERDARRLDLTESLSPQWLHEAQWHLKQARQKGGKLHPANFAADRLSRLGEPFAWTCVLWTANRLKQRADEVFVDERVKAAKVLVDAAVEHFKESFFYDTHPLDFVFAATLASELAKRLSSEEERSSLYRIRNQFLAQGTIRLQGCTYSDAEERACSYVLKTSKACMEFDEMRIHLANNRNRSVKLLKITERLAQDYKQYLAQDYEQYDSEIIDQRWFEYMGDLEHDHAKAMSIYKRGIVNPGLSPLPSILVKYLGCAAIGKECISEDVHNALLAVKKDGRPFPQGVPCFYFLKEVQERWNGGKPWYDEGPR